MEYKKKIDATSMDSKENESLCTVRNVPKYEQKYKNETKQPEEEKNNNQTS